MITRKDWISLLVFGICVIVCVWAIMTAPDSRRPSPVLTNPPTTAPTAEDVLGEEFQPHPPALDYEPKRGLQGPEK